MGYSTPGFFVLHHLPELAQIHVHWVSDAIQPSPFPSPPAFSLSQHQGLFSESTLDIRWPKHWASALASVLQMNFRVDFLLGWLVWSPCSPRDSEESSPTPQFKSINSLALSLLYGPTLTSMRDYWKNHSFDYMDLCWQTDVSIGLLTLYEYKWIKDLYRKAKTVKLSEENIGEKLQDTGFGNDLAYNTKSTGNQS